MKNPTDELPEFLKGFAANKPDNPYSARLWEGMRRKIAESGERLAELSKDDDKIETKEGLSHVCNKFCDIHDCAQL